MIYNVLFSMLCTFFKGLFLNPCTFFKGLFVLLCHFFKGLCGCKDIKYHRKSILIV